MKLYTKRGAIKAKVREIITIYNISLTKILNECKKIDPNISTVKYFYSSNQVVIYYLKDITKSYSTINIYLDETI